MSNTLTLDATEKEELIRALRLATLETARMSEKLRWSVLCDAIEVSDMIVFSEEGD